MPRCTSSRIFVLTSLLLFFSCQDQHPANEKQIVASPEEMDVHVSENLKEVMHFALANNGKVNDTVQLSLPLIVDSFYRSNQYNNIWSKDEKWMPVADTLYDFIRQAELYGLFPSDYHFAQLSALRKKLEADSLARMDATVWTIGELALSDAFMKIAKHLKEGRLVPDSSSLSSDTTLTNAFFIRHLAAVTESGALMPVLHSLQPGHRGYTNILKGMRAFLDSMDRKQYTWVGYPYKDSMAFVTSLQRRLQEGNYLDTSARQFDSAGLANGIRNFQKRKGLKADGKVSATMVRLLNTNDLERFKRIAINLDRYKQLPEHFPEKYIWVNLPGYYLRVYDHDTVVFESKTIVGKPSTRTPELVSEISDMVTYPQWTIPNSIIKKDIIPAMKRNIEYLTRKGFHLVDLKGDPVDPYTVNWSKYTKGIPYKIVQGSGDGNALGILKFNFENPYSVYLHDTNQRYLFKNAARALSHGCVRVQEWNKLALYLAANDSLNRRPGETLSYNADSLRNWLANKERKKILLKNKVPLYIRYFTVEGNNGRIIFYDDIYNEDKILCDKYFANK